jgi:hypothetical protein
MHPLNISNKNLRTFEMNKNLKNSRALNSFEVQVQKEFKESNLPNKFKIVIFSRPDRIVLQWWFIRLNPQISVTEM